MDQKEHIATLCALGTVGVAAAGLAFGTQQVDPQSLRPGKRKWPGSSSAGWPNPSDTIPASRRIVSQPATPTLSNEVTVLPSQSIRSQRQWSAPKTFFSGREDISNDVPSSRGSSVSRRSMLRPQTATSRSTTRKRESSTSSNWLKRISSFSSHSTSPAPSIIVSENKEVRQASVLSRRPATSVGSMPNKLVKRSVSQRGLSHDEARGQILRRPVTSHQRSQTFKEILSRPISNDIQHKDGSDVSSTAPASLPPITRPSLWRPFFETGFPRKRRRSETATDAGQIRVVSLQSAYNNQDPVMVLGSEMDGTRFPSDIDDWAMPQTQPFSDPDTGARRSRRSLSSLRKMTRRRNFTDPSVHLSRTPANGTISPVKNHSQGSPALSGSAFHVQLPPGTPQFASSPPMSNYHRRSSFRPYGSTSTSDPPTASSDTDGRVFTDEDSVDFKSDTAYDSIATRTTNASHSGARDSKLETIFAARTSAEHDAQQELWNTLREEKDLAVTATTDGVFHHHDVDMHGIGISITDNKDSSTVSGRDDITMVTPPLSPSLHAEDMSVTPVPMKGPKSDLPSSPPLFPTLNHTKDYDQVGEMLDDMKLDEDEEVNWSADDDSMLDHESRPWVSRQIMSSPGGAPHHLIARFQEQEGPDELQNGHAQKPSIFDWSEHQQVTNFSRPKTVHGKQTNGDRSRSSGKKGPPQLHFRSQSVPVNRDGPADDLPTKAKFQTWRLGAKPVSEEWSDDFEFDDVEQVEAVAPVVEENRNAFRDSVRSVRIPQAIMDRQPSVHVQFGQVQEFMALVEELKRLRAKGMEMRILNGTSKYLWEDAESIINLATINDEEDHIIPTSPPSSDPFADLTNVTPNTNPAPAVRGRRPTTSGRRSVSTLNTPPMHGRARGESLAQARHFLQAMHHDRSGFDSSPREIEIHHQKKLPFDTQDLKDLVVRSGAITRALKEEVRRAEGVSISPHKTPPSKKTGYHLSEIFRVPETCEANSSPCPPYKKPGLPKSRSANGYLEISSPRHQSGPFSSPIGLATIV